MSLKKLFLLLVALLAGAASLAAQNDKLTVNGTVVDEDGNALAAVTVFDANAPGTGTMTNENGAFSIIVGKKCKSLTFELLGFKRQTVGLRDASLVKMTLDVESLGDVVVTGIFTRKAESFTGAVQTIGGEELKMASSHNVMEALKNIDPSLLMVENLEAGSNPNTMASFQLRGASSFISESTGLKSNFVSDANMPLFILDGFETTIEKITDMDMNRVQSITILKDASAKAIYGAKGGNGVIVIETKSLDSGRPAAISYSGQVALEMPDLTSYNLCDALQKLEIERREGYYTSSNSLTQAQAQNVYYDRLKKAKEGESTYWLSKPLRTGVTNKHSVSVELGNRSLKSFTTFSYNNTQGAMKGSDRRVITGDMSIQYRHKIWTFRNIMSISSMKSNESPYGEFEIYSLLNPYTSPYDSEGNLLKTLEFGNGTYRFTAGNPLYDATLNVVNSSNYLDFNDNFYVEVLPVESLKIVGRLGINSKRTGADVFLPASHSSFSNISWSSELATTRGSYDKTEGEYLYFDGDVSAQFNKQIAGVHDIFATAQYSISQTKFSEVTNYAVGFPNSRMSEMIFARQYPDYRTPTGDSGLNRNLGLLLTTGYSYDSRYMMDATIKGSASSVFGTDNKWGTFWSFGLAWNLHNESWLKSVDWISQLKLRASVGSSGNQNYTTNTSLPVYKYYNTAYYNGFTGVSLENMENPLLGWEQKMDYNVGADFRSKHVNATIDAYIADTRNLVFNRSILPSTGFGTVSDNLGQVRNKGIELSVTYKIFQKNQSYLALFGKVAVNDNRILKISDELRAYNEQQISDAEAAGAETPVIQYYDGAPLNSIWVVRSLGINPTDGFEVFVDRNGNMTNKWNPADLYNAGSSDPLFNGNFGINGEIKGFGFSVIMTFHAGGYKFNSTLLKKIENTTLDFNVDARIFADRWYYPGQVTPYRNGSSSATMATDRFVQRNNLMTMSNATVYYEFPRQLISKIKLERLRASIVGNDLFNVSSIHIERGTNYPFARTVSFQLTATF